MWKLFHVITAHIRRMTEGNVFTSSTIHFIHRRAGRGYPPSPSDWMRVPPTPGDSSTASTCYKAGGMPLAFTQEDFLVYYIISWFNLRFRYELMLKCWNENPKERPTFQQIVSQMNTHSGKIIFNIFPCWFNTKLSSMHNSRITQC